MDLELVEARFPKRRSAEVALRLVQSSVILCERYTQVHDLFQRFDSINDSQLVQTLLSSTRSIDVPTPLLTMVLKTIYITGKLPQYLKDIFDMPVFPVEGDDKFNYKPSEKGKLGFSFYMFKHDFDDWFPPKILDAFNDGEFIVKKVNSTEFLKQKRMLLGKITKEVDGNKPIGPGRWEITPVTNRYLLEYYITCNRAHNRCYLCNIKGHSIKNCPTNFSSHNDGQSTTAASEPADKSKKKRVRVHKTKNERKATKLSGKLRPTPNDSRWPNDNPRFTINWRFSDHLKNSITMNRFIFTTFTPIKDKQIILNDSTAGNGYDFNPCKTFALLGHGTVPVVLIDPYTTREIKLILKNVLYVPDLGANIFAMTEFFKRGYPFAMDQKGASTTYNNEKFYLAKMNPGEPYQCTTQVRCA